MSDPKYVQKGSIYYRTIEECSELIKEICKAKRFGFNNYHPKDPTRLLNRSRIAREVRDLTSVLDELRIKLNIERKDKVRSHD